MRASIEAAPMIDSVAYVLLSLGVLFTISSVALLCACQIRRRVHAGEFEIGDLSQNTDKPSCSLAETYGVSGNMHNDRIQSSGSLPQGHVKPGGLEGYKVGLDSELDATTVYGGMTGGLVRKDESKSIGAGFLMQSMLTSVVIGGYEADTSLPKQAEDEIKTKLPDFGDVNEETIYMKSNSPVKEPTKAADLSEPQHQITTTAFNEPSLISPVPTPVLEDLFNSQVKTKADEVTVYTTDPTVNSTRRVTITRIKTGRRKKVRKRKKKMTQEGPVQQEPV